MLTSHLNQIHPFATPAPLHPQTSKGRVQIKPIKYVSMLIPPLDPPTSVGAIGYFFHHLFLVFGLLGTLSNRFCKILVKFSAIQCERRTALI